jgi:hypothetical protein
MNRSRAQEAQMKIDITMTIAFALFYAIMFGNARLNDSRAFAREDAER